VPVTFSWKGKQVAAEIRGALAPRVIRAAEYVAELARTKAPVRTGQLRASIHVEPGPAPLAARVVADAPHAVYVEVGTRLTPAHAFLRPAVAEGQTEVKRILSGL